MKMIDIIAAQIKDMIDRSEEDFAEIRRNEMAEYLGCVPSQINYVLSSRFTPERGYIVESRRGGGGYIRISRVRLDRTSALMHVINTIGERLSDADVRVFLDNCMGAGLIDDKAGKAMTGALSAVVMRQVPGEVRDSDRATLLKQMLGTQI